MIRRLLRRLGTWLVERDCEQLENQPVPDVLSPEWPRGLDHLPPTRWEIRDRWPTTDRRFMSAPFTQPETDS